MLTENFVERVHAVAWSSFKQGLGPLSIPDGIVGLGSHDPVTRESSRAQLENKILPQDTLIEATYYAIPFLIELIEKGGDQAQTAYELVLPIALCSARDAYDDGIEWQGVSLSLTRACREQLSRGLKYYLRDMQDEALSRDCRLSAFSIISHLPEYRQEAITTVSEILRREKDQEMREAISEWLCSMSA